MLLKEEHVDYMHHMDGLLEDIIVISKGEKENNPLLVRVRYIDCIVSVKPCLTSNLHIFTVTVEEYCWYCCFLALW